MADTAARLYLITPVLDDASFAPRLAEACATGAVAAVLLRLAPADERGLTNLVKALAPAAQEHGAAVIVASEAKADLANVAARGGADGVHIPGDPARLRELRERLKSERAIGAGAIRSKDDAMGLGRGRGRLPALRRAPSRRVPALPGERGRAGGMVGRDLRDALRRLSRRAWRPSRRSPRRRPSSSRLGDAVWSHPEGPAAAVKAAAEILERQEASR